MTTTKQKNAVRYCEKWLGVVFEGDINDFATVSAFLDDYLEMAKVTVIELKSEYDSFVMDLD